MLRYHGICRTYHLTCVVRLPDLKCVHRMFPWSRRNYIIHLNLFSQPASPPFGNSMSQYPNSRY
jgi:hypothetical protein